MLPLRKRVVRRRRNGDAVTVCRSIERSRVVRGRDASGRGGRVAVGDGDGDDGDDDEWGEEGVSTAARVCASCLFDIGRVNEGPFVAVPCV